MMLNHRFATLDDVPTLASMNRQLVQDEQHRNRFKSDAWLEERMCGFLAGGYEAVLFEQEGDVVAYALYAGHRDNDDTIHLRQIFVDREHRRLGIGKEAVRILMEQVWPGDKRITVGVLVGNRFARAFYEAVGFKPYSMELEVPASERNVRSERDTG